MTRSGHCNPLFKEALREALSVLEGIAAAESVPRETRTGMIGVWERHVGSVWGVPPGFCSQVPASCACAPLRSNARYRSPPARGLLPGTSSVAPRERVQPGGSHLVSRTATEEAHPRLPPRHAPPQCGQGNAVAGWWRAGGNAAALLSCAGSMRRMAAVGMGQRALSKPPWRTCMPPEGTTGGRKRRRNSRTSRWVGRGRARQGTMRSVRETRRRVARATVKTEGARDVKAVAPCGGAWRGTVQGLCQPGGSLCSRSPAGRMASAKLARELGDRALTGTEQVAREGRQASRFFARPPPGTREGMGGWDCGCLPQGCRTPGKPGRAVPRPRWSWASRGRAVADAGPLAWDARRWGERSKGRRVAGTVQGRRQDGPGRGGARWCARHGGVVCC